MGENMKTILKISTIWLVLVLVVLNCNKKGKVLTVPFQKNEESTSPDAKTYISEETITPPIHDYDNESSLPVDFGVSVSAALDVPDLQFVDRFKPIPVLFSTMMNKQSVENNFVLKDAADNPVEGTFFWIGKKLYFKPYRPLQPQTMYTVRIGADAKNFDGFSFGSEFVQSFTTEPAFLMDHKLILGSTQYNADPVYANNGVIIDKGSYTNDIVVESTLTGADFVTRVRLFRLGLGENDAYTICDSNSPCNNDTSTTGKFNINLSSLANPMQPKDGENIYYYYLETSSGRTYVRTFAFHYGRVSNNPLELQSNGGWLALESNFSSKGMYQIERLLERFIKSNGSGTGDNFRIENKIFNDYVNNPKYNWGPINNPALGCQLDDSDWTNSTNRISYITNFGPYCNMSFEVCAIFCGTGYADNYVGLLNISQLDNGGNQNIDIKLLPDATKLRIELWGKKLNGMLRSYVRDGGFPASLANGYVIEDRFFMNQSSSKLSYAHTHLTVNANGDMVITIFGGPNWPINHSDFNVEQWANSIDSTSDWSIIDGSWLDWLLSIFIPGVINQLTPRIVQGTIKDTIQVISPRVMNAVLAKTRVDSTNDGINICLPGYLPDPLKTICLDTGAKMKPSSTHIGWSYSGVKGIRAFLETSMTVRNTNAGWPRPPALVGPGNTHFIKFMPSGWNPDANLVSLFYSKSYQGAMVVLNPDVVNQAAYGLWKEGAFNFNITKPVLDQINNIAGNSNYTVLADKLFKADAILTVIAPGQTLLQIKDQNGNLITIDKNDPVKVETLLLYPPALNPIPNWKRTNDPEELLLNNASFTGFRLKLIGGKDSNNDGVADYDFYTIANVVVNLTTKASINFVQYSNPNNYIPDCSDGHCRALSISLSYDDADIRYTIEIPEDNNSNPLGLDPRSIYEVFNPLIKSFVAPLVGNVLKEIPFDADMSACGLKVNEVRVVPTPTSYNDPFAILEVQLGEKPFAGNCDL